MRTAVSRLERSQELERSGEWIWCRVYVAAQQVCLRVDCVLMVEVTRTHIPVKDLALVCR